MYAESQRVGYHNADAVDRALSQLTEEDFSRLRTAARIWFRAFGLDGVARDPDDLVCDAISRTTSGRRSWKVGVDFDHHLREEMLDAGEDPKATADRLRAKMREAAERGRKHRLKVLRKRWQRSVARIQALDHGLPDTPAQRLDLLYTVIEAEPQLRQQITVQHRDLKELSDADVTRFLNQLTELGALDDLWDEGEGE